MKPKTVYVCEICGRQKDSPGEAMMCEEKHILPQKIVKACYREVVPRRGIDRSHLMPQEILVLFKNGELVRYQTSTIVDSTQ